MVGDRGLVLTALSDLEKALRGTGARVAEMIGSGVEAGQARSIELLHAGIEVALSNLDPIQAVVTGDEHAHARELARDMATHVAKEIARPQILDDLEKVVAEAEEELQHRVGRHRNPVKYFIAHGQALPAEIAGIAGAADRTVGAVAAWAAPGSRKETEMSDENLKAIENAIQQVGRQLSFLSSRGAGAGDLSPGAGEYRSVTAQVSATLDALGMPHHGVQFATEKTTEAALDMLIESLQAEFREEVRNGNKVYVLGETARRAVSTRDGRLLAGAAKSAARRVRAEADNILDILDRLPDLNRFRTQQGALAPKDARDEVAQRFLDLDEVLAEPYGVNVPRAFYTLRRVFKGLLDYFDYANLEPEFWAAVSNLERPEDVPEDLLPIRDPDEVAKRRSPSVSEEIIYEIRELGQAYLEILGDVAAPVLNRLGNAAARLEMYLTTAYNTARDYRDILVRSGTSLPEQDLLAFTAQARAVIIAGTQQVPGTTEAAKPRMQIELTVDQVMDWIVDVAQPFVAADFRANLRERGSLQILAAELTAQSAAIQSLVRNGQELGFAISLYGPMRQLEELRYYIDRAREQADILAGTNRGQPTQP